MHPDLNDILAKLIGMLVLALGGMAINYIRAHTKMTNLVSGQRKIALAQEAAHLAVQAVEQMAKAGAINPQAKLYEAAIRAKGIAESKGVVLSDEEWRTLLEQAVKALNLFAPVIAIPAQPPPGQAVASGY